MVPALPAEEGSVMVVVRVRPQTPREQEANRQSVVQVAGNSMLVFDPEESNLSGFPVSFQAQDSASKRKGKNLTFAFDRVFGESSTQAEVFENTTKGILDSVLNGYNCSVFAYGATGAGKTHTMLGSEKEPGIMYLTMRELYKKIEARKEEKHCEVLISYQEVYNEQIHDLLDPKGPLAIREDPEKGVVVQGLSFHQPKTAAQLLEMLRQGNLNRTQHSTDINATSSRSHAVFQIYVKQQDCMIGTTRDLQVAKMSLIDLAGSERASVANTKGERLREGANINRSLLALINVINSLADAKNKKNHIPYRDSKLTRLLKDSIGGNCRTIMIAAISPSALSYEDTYNTLKYANRAKEIKLLMKRNVVSLDYSLSQYAVVCEQLRAEVADLRGRLRAYEQNNPDPNSCVPPSLVSSSPEHKDEYLRSKEDAVGSEVHLKGDCETKELGKNLGYSCVGSSNPDEQQEKLNTWLQEMDKKQLETLAITILHIAQKQYTLLKTSNLLTPDMRDEFEELDGLVQQGSCKAPEISMEEQVRKLEADTHVHLDQNTEQIVDKAVVPAALSTAECANPEGGPGVSPVLAIPSPSFKAPSHLTKKRRKSTEPSSPSESSTPSGPKGRAKRRRKAGPSPQPVDTLKEWAALMPMESTSTPIVGKSKSQRPTSCLSSQPCSLTETKRRVPLGTSAVQNCTTPMPPPCLNTTFDLGEDPCSSNAKSSAPACPAWENIPHFSHSKGAPLIPRASMPVFTMKGSSIPRPSSLTSKVSTQKRRHTTTSASQSLGAPRSRIARPRGTSVKSSQAGSASGQPPAWKWR